MNEQQYNRKKCCFHCDTFRETLINCLRKQIAALVGARKLAYLFDMSRFLRSIRLALRLLGELLSASLRITFPDLFPENISAGK